MRWSIAWLIVAGIIATGCAEPSRNLYQGIQMRNEIKQSPEERAASPRPPSYDQYQKERDQLKNGDTGETSQR